MDLLETVIHIIVLQCCTDCLNMNIYTTKKKEKSTKNVFNSIIVITFFSSIMSVHPTTNVEKNGIRRAKLNNFFCYGLPFVYIIIYTYCLIVANGDGNGIASKREYDFNRIAYLLYVVTVLTEIMITYLQYGMTIFTTNIPLHILEVIRKADILIEKIGYRFKYVTAFVVNMLVICSGMFFIAFNIGLELWNAPRENIGKESFFEAVVLNWPQFLIHLTESMFILAKLLHYSRFFAVNLIMETLFVNKGGKDYMRETPGFMSQHYQFIMNPEVSHEYVIYCCMKAQYALFRCSVKLNNVYGIIVTFSTLIQFTTIAFAICFCYYKFTTKPVASIVWLLWAVLRLYELIRKACIVHLLKGEADKSIYFVNKLMMLPWEPKITRRLDIFLLQLRHCKVQFTACGLFAIDGTIVFTIIAAATMYLIVTYQFQQGQTNYCSNSTLA